MSSLTLHGLSGQDILCVQVQLRIWFPLQAPIEHAIISFLMCVYVFSEKRKEPSRWPDTKAFREVNLVSGHGAALCERRYDGLSHQRVREVHHFICLASATPQLLFNIIRLAHLLLHCS